jgi:hypothetical protein
MPNYLCFRGNDPWERGRKSSNCLSKFQLLVSILIGEWSNIPDSRRGNDILLSVCWNALMDSDSIQPVPVGIIGTGTSFLGISP